MATSYYVNSAGTYTAADYTINGGTGSVTMEGNGSTSASTAAPGGTLAVTAGNIDISTIVEVPSGQIELTATNNINISSDSLGNGQLLARGTAYAPGGAVSLMSTGGGTINIASGAVIDVSAYQGQGSQGDAGSISLYAPSGVTLNGNILGQAYGGKGGSFSMVTGSLDTTGSDNLFSDLNSRLNNGFSGAINIEATTGNITIANGEQVYGSNVTITADSGSMYLYGAINASGPAGGTVGLYAANNLTVENTGVINAGGQSGSGGNVTLAVAGSGVLTFANGGQIEVPGTGGGTVTFEAPVTSNGTVANFTTGLPSKNVGLNMTLNGTVTGASSIVADAVNTYLYSTGELTISTSASSSPYLLIGTVQTNTSNFMTKYSGGLLKQSISGGVVVVQPGILIENTGGDINLSSPWNFYTSAGNNWHFGGEPGTLTLRASGNLYIGGNITDAVTPYNSLLSAAGDHSPSWSFNLVAGANTKSADILAVTPAASGGGLYIGTYKNTSGKLVTTPTVVYTETGAIQFASGGDTTVYKSPSNTFMIAGGSSSMPYSLATYLGNISGNVEGNLFINPDAAIQTAVGTIDISVGKDLDLVGNNAGVDSPTTALHIGAIRTTGEHGAGYKYNNYYSYYNGGSISLDVGGNVIGGLNPNAWLYSDNGISYTVQNVRYYPVMPVYTQATNNANSQTVYPTEGIAAMAGGSVSVTTGGYFDCQIGTFGQGNLQVYSGGDVSGRFFVKQGTGVVSAMGNFGSPSLPQLLEMGASQVSVSAQGSIEVGGVVNPNLAAVSGSQNYWDNGYTQSSSVSLTAVTGDVDIYNSVNSTSYGTLGHQTYLPPTVSISAGGDIVVSANNVLQLPAQYGNLSMRAGGDIVFEPLRDHAVGMDHVGRRPGLGLPRLPDHLFPGLDRPCLHPGPCRAKWPAGR